MGRRAGQQPVGAVDLRLGRRQDARKHSRRKPGQRSWRSARRDRRGPFGIVLLRGVFAGWLIALMVWLLPVAERGSSLGDHHR